MTVTNINRIKEAIFLFCFFIFLFTLSNCAVQKKHLSEKVNELNLRSTHVQACITNAPFVLKANLYPSNCDAFSFITSSLQILTTKLQADAVSFLKNNLCIYLSETCRLYYLMFSSRERNPA